MKKKVGLRPHVIPEIEDWPIYKLHENRADFVRALEQFTMERLLEEHDDIADIIAKTIYLERIRVKEEPWKVDPPNEQQFWRKMRSKLGRNIDRAPEEAEAISREILQRIVHRYSEEIVGTFKKPTFLFARRFLTFFFNRLLNTAANRNFKRIWSSKYSLFQKLIAKGEVEKIRALMKQGTVVVVPTHSSNLDSILIGYMMDQIVGLPSFSYGAGLNLYNTGYTAYYMNRLGAYRVDRRKKNPIYLETLKAMSNLAIQKGTNSLFFPGGTRSRSGELENKLKMGLLGTAVDAQRATLERGEDQKVFIVPLILCYHMVLEAGQLIEQHLQRTGKELYLPGKKKFSFTKRKIFNFMWKIFSNSSEITLSFGKPMDVLGNFVDENGISRDRFGKEVSVKDYFVSDGEVTKDLQREREYTKLLATRIAKRYYKENIVLSSHLVAFAAFRILAKLHPKLDLYGVLRLPVDDFHFPMDLMEKVIADLQKELQNMEQNGQIKLSKEILLSPTEILLDGLKNLGIFHAEKPLIKTKKGLIVSQSFKVLYFYHNRLCNYGLEQAIDWKKINANEEMLEVV